MSYRQDSQRKARRLKLSALLVAILAIFYFFSQPILMFGYSVFSYFAIPLWSIERSVSDSLFNLPKQIGSKQALINDNEDLRRQIEDLNIRLSLYSVIEKENQDLMLEMGSMGKRKGESALVSVLSGPNIPPYDSLIIDAGRQSGLMVGDRVVFGSSVLIGEISELYERSAKVKLYSGSGITTDVTVPLAANNHAVAIGYGGGNYYMELPSSVAVSSGQLLMIPGGDNLMLGTIDYVQLDVTTASQKILIRTPFNIRNVKYLHVLKGVKDGLPK